MNDPGIICFKHCNDSPIFCEKVPRKCPICITTIPESTTPFRIPNPFVNAVDCSTSIIIRPSTGTFLNDYEYTDDLHIGIVDSRAQIYEYDQRGIIFNDVNAWRECISLQKIVPESWNDHWDTVLMKLSQCSSWNQENYHVVHWNCFNFVIEFIRQLGFKDFSCENKEEICRNFILPKIKESLRYITIYRALRKNDFYVDFLGK